MKKKAVSLIWPEDPLNWKGMCPRKWDRLRRIGLKMIHVSLRFFVGFLFVYFLVGLGFFVSSSMNTFCSWAECLPSLHNLVGHIIYLYLGGGSSSSVINGLCEFSPGVWKHTLEYASSSWCPVSCDHVAVPAGYVAAQPAKSSCRILYSLTSTLGNHCSLTLTRLCKSFVIFSLLCEVAMSFWN